MNDLIFWAVLFVVFFFGFRWLRSEEGRRQ